MVIAVLACVAGITHFTVASRRGRFGASILRATAPLAFAFTLTVGLIVTYFGVRSIPPTVPHPTEAQEGIGDAMRAQYWLYLGAGLSLLAACVAGFAAGIWAESRSDEGKDAEQPAAPAGDKVA